MEKSAISGTPTLTVAESETPEVTLFVVLQVEARDCPREIEAVTAVQAESDSGRRG